MIVKMTILRLLGSSDDKEKEKIGVARPEGPPLRGFIGALDVLCSRDDASRARAKSSAPVEPVKHRCIPSV